MRSHSCLVYPVGTDVPKVTILCHTCRKTYHDYLTKCPDCKGPLFERSYAMIYCNQCSRYMGLGFVIGPQIILCSDKCDDDYTATIIKNSIYKGT